MKLLKSLFLILVLTSCAVHNYDRTVNTKMLDVVVKNKDLSIPTTISGVKSIRDLELSYTYRKPDFKTIYTKQLKSILGIKSDKKIREDYVLLSLAVKDRIHLITALNNEEIKPFLIQNPKSELITEITFLYPKKDLKLFTDSSKVLLTIRQGISSISIWNDKGKTEKKLHDLLIMNTKTSHICFGTKGYTGFEIIDVSSKLGSKCLKPKEVKLKKSIYEGF